METVLPKLQSRDARAAFASYKEMSRRDVTSELIKLTKFKRSIYKLRRSRPNPKTGGWFISPNGVNENSGLDYRNPIDLQSFIDEVFPYLAPRDKVYFQRNGIYSLGDLAIPQNSITVGAYGSGADPIITGSTSLSAATWTSETGGYYSTPLASAPKWVAKNNRLSRQGESAWIPFTSAPSGTTRGANTATLNAFNTVQSLVGCKFRYKEFGFRLSFENTITNYNTGTGVLTASTFVGGGVGMPMKLYGQKQFATLEGDWWWDESNSKLWIKTASTPSGTNIRVITEDRAFTVDSKSGVTFTGLEFQEYYQEAIYTSEAETLTISDCSFHDIRTNAVYGKGTPDAVTISGNTITRCGLNGLSFGPFTNFEITDNDITEICEQGNIGWPLDATWLKTGGCGVAFNWQSLQAPQNGHIHLNRMSDLGYCGVLIMGDDHILEKNVVHDICEKWNDGAGLYTIHRSTLGPSTENVIIRDNIVYNSVGTVEGVVGEVVRGEGVYIDNGCRYTVVQRNTIYDCTSYGVVVNFDTRDSQILDNVLRNNGIAQLIIREDTNPVASPVYPNQVGNIVTGNTFACGQSTRYGVITESINGNVNFNPFITGGSSDNNHYISPYNPSTIAGYRVAADGAATSQSLAQWRTKFSLDAASNAIVNLLTYYSDGLADREIVLVTNPTNASANTSSIGAGYTNVSGAAISGVQSIAAFNSLLYVTTASRALLADHFTASDGTSISGRAPAVGNTPNVASGTHTITSNRMVSSVLGTVTWNVGTPNYVIEKSGIVTSTSAQFYLNFRLQDNAGSTSNRILINFLSGTTLQLREYVASATPTNTVTTPFTVATSTEYRMKVIVNGSSIKVYIDDVLYIDFVATLLTGTFVGIIGSNDFNTDYITVYPLN